jgi:hypothetical protein
MMSVRVKRLNDVENLGVGELQVANDGEDLVGEFLFNPILGVGIGNGDKKPGPGFTMEAGTSKPTLKTLPR